MSEPSGFIDGCEFIEHIRELENMGLSDEEINNEIQRINQQSNAIERHSRSQSQTCCVIM